MIKRVLSSRCRVFVLVCSLFKKKKKRKEAKICGYIVLVKEINFYTLFDGDELHFVCFKHLTHVRC